MRAKTVRESRSELSQIMVSNQTNQAGTIHAAEIFRLMDNAAGVAVARHTRKNMLTARVNDLEFIRPVYVGDFLICTSQIIFTGKSSLVVKVIAEVEDLLSEQKRERVASGYFTIVSLDEQSKPTEVPVIIPETEEEKTLFAEGQHRYLESKRKK
ncbi:MAG: hotdog domain-containing protein, partial [Peptococcia bacterium]